MTENEIAAMIEQASKEDWPPYATKMYAEFLLLRRRVETHLEEHGTAAKSRGDVLRTVLMDVLKIVVGGLLIWLLAGRLPGIFKP